MNAFRAFKRIDDVSKRVLWDLDRLRGAILQANFRVDQSFTLPAMQDRRQSLSESVHDYLQCNVEMSLQDEGTIYEEMALKAQRSRGAVACYLKDLMVMLHQAEILGRIHWVSNDACVFDWHQYLVEKSQIGRTTKTLSDRWRHETTYTASMIHELHRHEVLDAECRPLGLMRGMPTRVQRLVAELQQIPWLAPQIHIIDGYEIVHQTLSEVVAEKTWSQVTDEMKPLPPPRRFQEFKPDPAIVFGSYVLTGWEVGGL